MTDLSAVVLPTCAVVGCEAEVDEPGEICRRHGTVCPNCRHECTPYRAQIEWWQSHYWACDNCDAEIPGYE